MLKRILIALIVIMAFPETAPAQYPGWKHVGSIYVLTTTDGANVSASASETGFPLLVRLHQKFSISARPRPMEKTSVFPLAPACR